MRSLTLIAHRMTRAKFKWPRGLRPFSSKKARVILAAASTFGGMTRALVVSVALIGCAAAERPTLEALVARKQWVDACKRLAYGDRIEDVRARKEGTRKLGVNYRTTIDLVPETLERANERFGRILLGGEVSALEVSALSEGPSVGSTRIMIDVRYDGTLWRSLGTHQADRVLLARLFGSNPTIEDPRIVNEPPKIGRMDEESEAKEKYKKAVERCDSDANPCKQWFPLARFEPSLGPEELVIHLHLWLKGPTGNCRMVTQRSIPLPPGKTLDEKLAALAARGPLEIRWGE